MANRVHPSGLNVNDDVDEYSTSLRRRPTPLLRSQRFALALWACFGFLNMYAQRVNLSVALVAMVNSTKSEHEDDLTCPQTINHNDTVSSTGEFNWDPHTQAIVLASFFYGYIVTQIPGGILADKFGGKLLFGVGGLCTSVLTLFTPLAARHSWQLLVAVRIVEGLGEGVTFPSMNSLWSHWAPPAERSTLATLAISGAQLGTILTLPIAGQLCQHVNWDSVFYIFGALGILWFGLWMFFVSDKPENNRFISAAECDYITSALKQRSDGGSQKKIPWCHIACSPRLWAIIIAHFCHNWSFYTLLTETPTFLNDILHFDIKDNSLISALPYVVQWILIITSGIVADLLRQNYLSTTMVRKVMSGFGFGLMSLCLFGMAYIGCHAVAAVALLIGATGFSGINFAGFNINHLDIAPDFAGVLLGITNCVATIPGFAGPQVVGAFTYPQPTIAGWRAVFLISSGVAAFGGACYLFLGSGEVQPWAKDPPDLTVSPSPCCGSPAPEQTRLLDGRVTAAPKTYDDR